MTEEVMDNEEMESLLNLIDAENQDADSEPDEDIEPLNVDGVDDPEQLKQMLKEYQERVHKRNVTIRKKKQATERMQGELAELREQMEKIAAGRDSAKEEPKQELDINQWSDKVIDDPVAALQYTDTRLNDLESRFANTLNQFQQNMAAMLQQVDPERVKYQGEIAKLKTNPQFADLDDTTLLKVAKVMSGVKVPRGNVGGKKAVTPPKPKEDPIEKAKNDAELMKKFGY